MVFFFVLKFKFNSKIEKKSGSHPKSLAWWEHVFVIRPFSIIISLSFWFLCSDNQLKINNYLWFLKFEAKLILWLRIEMEKRKEKYSWNVEKTFIAQVKYRQLPVGFRTFENSYRLNITSNSRNDMNFVFRYSHSLI